MGEIKEQFGYLWKKAAELDADAIVITTNGDVKKDGTAVMGAGCAKEAAKLWPNLPRMLGEEMKWRGNRVFVFRSDATPVYEDQRRTVDLICLPTKHHWREEADLDLIRAGIKVLAKKIEEHRWKRIVLPRPGAGYGQLAWRDVRPILVEALDERCTVVTWGVKLRYKNGSGDYNSTTHYSAPNENLKEWASVVDKKVGPINRAAAVASGGEIGLLAILPQVERELILVDHSYSSIAGCMLKWMLIKEHGEKAFDMLTATGQNFETKPVKQGTGYYARSYNNHVPLKDAPKDLVLLHGYLSEYVTHLPEDLRKKVHKEGVGSVIWYVLQRVDGHGKCFRTNAEIARYWKEAGKKRVAAAAEKADLVRFVHGDLTTDARQERRPLDLIYCSNIHGHGNRHGKTYRAGDFQSVVRPGGFIMIANNTYEELRDVDPTKGWETLSGNNTNSWKHSLYRTPPKVTPKVARQKTATTQVAAAAA